MNSELDPRYRDGVQAPLIGIALRYRDGAKDPRCRDGLLRDRSDSKTKTNKSLASESEPEYLGGEFAFFFFFKEGEFESSRAMNNTEEHQTKSKKNHGLDPKIVLTNTKIKEETRGFGFKHQK